MKQQKLPPTQTGQAPKSREPVLYNATSVSIDSKTYILTMLHRGFRYVAIPPDLVGEVHEGRTRLHSPNDRLVEFLHLMYDHTIPNLALMVYYSGIVRFSNLALLPFSRDRILHLLPRDGRQRVTYEEGRNGRDHDSGSISRSASGLQTGRSESDRKKIEHRA